MKSIRTIPANHAVEGDERIRTAEQALGADLAYDARPDIEGMRDVAEHALQRGSQHDALRHIHRCCVIVLERLARAEPRDA